MNEIIGKVQFNYVIENAYPTEEDNIVYKDDNISVCYNTRCDIVTIYDTKLYYAIELTEKTHNNNITDIVCAWLNNNQQSKSTMIDIYIDDEIEPNIARIDIFDKKTITEIRLPLID